MSGQMVGLYVIGSANLLATLGIAFAAFKAKKEIDGVTTQVQVDVNNVRKNTNKTISKVAAALADLEV